MYFSTTVNLNLPLLVVDPSQLSTWDVKSLALAVAPENMRRRIKSSHNHCPGSEFSHPDSVGPSLGPVGKPKPPAMTAMNGHLEGEQS